jgi:hypothetical protein
MACRLAGPLELEELELAAREKDNPMVLTRSYARMLVNAGVAMYGEVRKGPRARLFREVIRDKRIDYIIAFDESEVPKEPPCWHPKGLPDHIIGKHRAPRRKRPEHDTLTEHGRGFKRWRRPPKASEKSKHPPRRRCPNCGTMTNAAMHCSGIKTVRIGEETTSPKRAKRATKSKSTYKPLPFKRVCQCGELTNERVHCSTLKTFAR